MEPIPALEYLAHMHKSFQNHYTADCSWIAWNMGARLFAEGAESDILTLEREVPTGGRGIFPRLTPIRYNGRPIYPDLEVDSFSHHQVIVAGGNPYNRLNGGNVFDPLVSATPVPVADYPLLAFGVKDVIWKRDHPSWWTHFVRNGGQTLLEEVKENNAKELALQQL
jgi:hypothetical protein